MPLSMVKAGEENTIKKIGGTLENAYEENGQVIDRYWIAL